MKLSVLIPVYNEKGTIKEILRRIKGVDLEKEIIVVDDGSTDGMSEILKEIKEKDIKILSHPRNMGKGAAIRTALGYVTGDALIIQDADLEYDPEDYHTLLEPIKNGKADVVYGSRFLGKGSCNLLPSHYLANRLLTFLSNMFNSLHLSDMETCYKMIKKEVLRDIRLEEKGFGFEPEITAKLAKKEVRICEVPISYYGRSYGAGKKIGWKDGFWTLWCILKYNLLRR